MPTANRVPDDLQHLLRLTSAVLETGPDPATVGESKTDADRRRG